MLEDAVIAKGDAWVMVEMAEFSWANKPKLEDAVIALEDAIMKSHDVKAIKEFLISIKSMTPLEIQDYMTNYFPIKEYLDAYKQKKSNVDQLKELLNLLTLDKVTSLFNQEFLPREVFQDYLHRLNKEKIIYEDTTQIDNTWLVNLSLTEPNVLPSMVKENREVLENTKLYLELLKKIDSDKYYDYKDAFEGRISFEDADKYYTYRYQKLK